MHEQDKLSEARYFAERLGKVQTREAFRFELSAFLSAARSVLQYASKEARGRTGGPAWYDHQVSRSPVVRFFKDKRDISVHRSPVTPSVAWEVTIRDEIHLSDHTLVSIRDPSDEALSRAQANQALGLPPVDGVVCIGFAFRFPDWSGSEDVPTLCQRYIVELEAIVADGGSRGFLTA